MRKPIIYIDMDDVTCDIKKAYRAIINNPTNEHEKKYPQSRIGFFANLEPMPDAIKSIKALADKYDVWFLSRPSFKNINCYTEKAQWILNHFGYEMQKKLILCGNKSLVKGDILIDDHTADGQLEFEGQLIRFGTEQCRDWISALALISIYLQSYNVICMYYSDNKFKELVDTNKMPRITATKELINGWIEEGTKYQAVEFVNQLNRIKYGIRI